MGAIFEAILGEGSSAGMDILGVIVAVIDCGAAMVVVVCGGGRGRCSEGEIVGSDEVGGVRAHALVGVCVFGERGECSSDLYL